MFGYGFLAVVLVLYLAALGLDPLAIGIVLTLTLVGDTLISLWLTTNADRFGRRRVLVAGRAADGRGRASSSRSRAGCRCSSSPATIGVISPTGNEVGPFLAVEQAALTQTSPTPPDRDVRLVQPRRLRRHRDRGAGAGPAQPGAPRRRAGAGRRLPRGRDRLRAHRRSSWPSGFWRLGAADRGPAARRRRRRHPAALRARSLEAGRRSACRSSSRSTPSAAGSSRRA